MNPEVFHTTLRQFLEQVSVTSQRQIEEAVNHALEHGEIKGNERLRAVMTLTIDQLEFTHIVEDDIVLE